MLGWHVFYNNSAFDHFADGSGEGVSGDGVADLIVTAQGLVIDTDGATITSYSLESDAGIFAGMTPNNLGIGLVDTDYLILAGDFTFSGTHMLGNVIGSEFSDTDLFQDLTFTFTTDRSREGTLIWPAANAGVIAPDKQALLPGETAGFANYTSYDKGINGIMVDVAGLPDSVVPTAQDFRFKVGNNPDPGTWADAASPADVTLRKRAGEDGSDRITIVWADNLVQKQWLQVTVLPTENTGLAEDDVFYFGNAIGESGNSNSDAKVNAFDMLGARNNQRSFVDPAPVDFAFDYNRDQRVNVFDMLIARNNATHFLNALELITVPDAKASIRDAALAQVYNRETSPGRLTWLHEFDEERPSAEKVGPVEESTDNPLMLSDT